MTFKYLSQFGDAVKSAHCLMCQANSITRLLKENSVCVFFYFIIFIFHVWCRRVSIQCVWNDIWARTASLAVLIGCCSQTDDLPFNDYTLYDDIVLFCMTGIRVWLKCSSNEILVHPVLKWIKICELTLRLFCLIITSFNASSLVHKDTSGVSYSHWRLWLLPLL